VRINVYSQELTEEVELVEKKSNTGEVYYGVRMYLASSDVLHNTPGDDDRSAITFWLPTSRHFNTSHLANVFRHMADLTNPPEKKI
jgi:hypothetical protein